MSEPRVIAITGATRGLGRALVGRFVALGHTVIGCGRNRAHLAELEREGGNSAFRPVDVADDAQVEAWASDAIDQYGAPDVLVNNAALINEPRPLWEVPAAEFDPVVDVNIKGVQNVIRHFVPAMVARGSGVIVNFSSGWGRSTSPGVAPYCATKWAIEGLSQALAQDLPSGLASIALNPGVINTEMLQIAFGTAGAAAYESPEEWSARAATKILGFGPRDNGGAETV